MASNFTMNLPDRTIGAMPPPSATSTVARKRPSKDPDGKFRGNTLEDSLGILSVKSCDLTDYSRRRSSNISLQDTSAYLQQQRMLASQSLHQRHSKVACLPSKYLRPSEVSTSHESYLNISVESTVNESDLFKNTSVTPISNTSTPRTSLASNSCNDQLEKSKFNIGESLSQLSYDISNNSNMSLGMALQKVEKEYEKAKMSMLDNSEMFIPGEDAAEKLLADEVSWKREKHIPSDLVNFTEPNLSLTVDSDVSIGAFFKQRSDDLYGILSHPRRLSNPSPLVRTLTKEYDSRNNSNLQTPTRGHGAKNYSNIKHNPTNEFSQLSFDNSVTGKDSLSVTEIARVLSNSEGTPSKVINYLLAQARTNKIGEREQRNNSSPQRAQSKLSCGYTSPKNKENINSLNFPTESLTGVKFPGSFEEKSGSERSTSSLSNLPNGKLPIETTHTELIWGCVKVGRSISQQFTIRNRSSKRIRLQYYTNGLSFKIYQESDSNRSTQLTLHSNEAKTLSVVFCPVVNGAAVDDLTFSTSDSNLVQTKKQFIRLFGYGGSGNVDFEMNITKDTTGRFWLSLGNSLHCPIVHKTFTVQNKGSLPAFGLLNFVPKDNFSFSKVDISPKEFVLKPLEEQKITISYKPTSDDFTYLKKYLNISVVEIGGLWIVSGAEVHRGRIRRLCRKAIEKKLELDTLSLRLQEHIEGEQMPGDLISFKESLGSMKLLLQELSRKEIVVTVEQDFDRTLVGSLPDETSMYHSFCQENSLIAIDNSIQMGSWKLEPSTIILNPPSKFEDFLFLISEVNETAPYNFIVPSCIEISPKEGHIDPYGTVVIKLRLKNIVQDRCSFNVVVNIDNFILQTEIKIMSIS